MVYHEGTSGPIEAVLYHLTDLIRPYVQPITHNLPSPIANIGLSLLGETCYKTLIHDVQPEDACVKLGVSKALGIAIILASSVVKIPQIMKLYKSKSAVGISFASYFLETFAYIINLAYNFRSGNPLSTYGETLFIMLQNMFICVMVLRYSGEQTAASIFVAFTAILFGMISTEFGMSMKLLSWLQMGAGVMSVASKVPQIFTIWADGTTGQLSAFAVFNYLLGSLTRIFTTIQEVDDPVILYGFIAGFLLNLVLAAQMIIYWNAPINDRQKKLGGPQQAVAPEVVEATGAQKRGLKGRRKA